MKTLRSRMSPWSMAIFLMPALVIYLCFLFIPILDSMRYSLFTGESMVPREWNGLQNYVTLFTKAAFRDKLVNAFVNNIEFFLIVTLIQNFLGFIIAFVLSMKFKGNNFLRKAAFLPTTMSVIVVGFVFKSILNPVWGFFDKILMAMGLENWIMPWLGDPRTALPVLAIVVSWQFMGESVLFYSAAIDQIPKELLEAARIDGASPLQELRFIILPSIIHVVGVVTLLIFIGDFTQFDIVYAMSTSTANPSYATDLFGSLFYRVTFSPVGRHGWGVGMGAAVSTIMTFILALGVTGLMRFFRKEEEKTR